jgi:hypothetical protein
MVKGMRENRSESLVLRRIPSRIANYLLRATSKCEVHDMGGLSIMRGDLARWLNLREGQHRLLPAILFGLGGSVVEVPTAAPPRFAGRSHYGLGRSVDVLFDIILLWFQNSFKQRPVYLFGRFALILFGLARPPWSGSCTRRSLRGAHGHRPHPGRHLSIMASGAAWPRASS